MSYLGYRVDDEACSTEISMRATLIAKMIILMVSSHEPSIP